MKKSLLLDALRYAYDYLPKHPQRNCYAHYSFVVQNNQIIEWATNSSREPPVHYGYHTRTDMPKFHAEIAAYMKARGLLKGRTFSCINIRLNKSGEIKLSAPCVCCYSLLTALGCGEFWYTVKCGWEKYERFL